jgi:hypothetical protein
VRQVGEQRLRVRDSIRAAGDVRQRLSHRPQADQLFGGGLDRSRHGGPPGAVPRVPGEERERGQERTGEPRRRPRRSPSLETPRKGGQDDRQGERERVGEIGGRAPDGQAEAKPDRGSSPVAAGRARHTRTAAAAQSSAIGTPSTKERSPMRNGHPSANGSDRIPARAAGAPSTAARRAVASGSAVTARMASRRSTESIDRTGARARAIQMYSV